MAYIGFFLIMAGLAAVGGALDGKGDIVCAVAMTMEGAALMWIFRETDEDSGENGDGPVSGGSLVDRPTGGDREGTGVADAERRE